MNMTTDDNNNPSKERSYSLRPRTSKPEMEDVDEEDSWTPLIRSRKSRKQKTAPLSKYRRKTANARERTRMREINDAFEVLRKTIPQLASTTDNSNEKISKIMTLRLAMKYITALSNALEEPTNFTLDFQRTLSLMDISSSFSPVDTTMHRNNLSISTPPMESSSSVDSSLSFSSTNHSFHNRIDLTAESIPSFRCNEIVSHREQRNYKFPSSLGKSTSNTFVNKLGINSRHKLEQRSYQEEVRHYLTPLDEPLPVSSDFDYTTSSSGNIDLNNTSSIFETDFTGLSSPVMDFCDLFDT